MPSFAVMDTVFDRWGKTEAKIIMGKSSNPATDWKAMNEAVGDLFK
jgi:hypothetical protein